MDGGALESDRLVETAALIDYSATAISNAAAAAAAAAG
jgi:hypothetical protein